MLNCITFDSKGETPPPGCSPYFLSQVHVFKAGCLDYIQQKNVPDASTQERPDILGAGIYIQTIYTHWLGCVRNPSLNMRNFPCVNIDMTCGLNSECGSNGWKWFPWTIWKHQIFIVFVLFYQMRMFCIFHSYVFDWTVTNAEMMKLLKKSTCHCNCAEDSTLPGSVSCLDNWISRYLTWN